MDNKFNTNITSQIIELQASYLLGKLMEQFKDTMTTAEINSLMSATMKRYYINVGRPLLIPRYAQEGHLPFKEEYSDMTEETVIDSSILYGEVERIGNTLVEHFNYAQSERLRIENTIKNISSLTSDLNLLSNENTANSIYLRDSFNDQKNIDLSIAMGVPAQISTREGIVTLSRNSTVNRSMTANIKVLQGDGEAGTFHVLRRVTAVANDTQTITNVEYISDQTPNNDSSVILDGRPDTIFEYQTVNFPRDKVIDVAKTYDVDWIKGNKANDKLRLNLVIELSEVADVNWININPYHPADSTNKLIVYSIRTSEDGFDYQPLYNEGNYVLNAEINTTPQTYRQDEIFDGSNDFSASKFAGQGVWSFATRKTKYIEVVFDQVESYDELIGHTYYERVTTTKDPVTGLEKETSIRIPSSQVSQDIIKGPTGKYAVKDKEFIRKGIDIFDGWRYAIGIRDINIMSYQFVEKSELITKKFSVDKPIKEVMLYANEKIPEAFLQDLKKANDWIQYFISFDDVNWHQISPVHHSPMSSEVFPPKIYELNSTNVDLQSSFQLYKEYLTTEQETKNIRLKVILQRPTNIYNATSFTPILEDYSLRIVFAEDSA